VHLACTPLPDLLAYLVRRPPSQGPGTGRIRPGRQPVPAHRHRRLRSFEDMILRFATRPDLDIFSNNEAGRTIRPVKVQQRSSGGCWRTLTGLADFALVESHLSTAAKWASANSTPSATYSTATPGCRPASNPSDEPDATDPSHHATDAW
jgi:hypothetical protein